MTCRRGCFVHDLSLPLLKEVVFGRMSGAQVRAVRFIDRYLSFIYVLA